MLGQLVKVFAVVLATAGPWLAVDAGAATDPARQVFARTVHDLQAEHRAARREGKRLAVLFEQADCPACASLARNVLGQRQAAGAGRAWRTVVARLDGEQAMITPLGEPFAPLDIAQQLQVLGTPAIVFFDGNGRLLYRHQGPLRDGEDLVLLARFVGEARYDEMPLRAYLQRHRKPAPVDRHAQAHH